MSDASDTAGNVSACKMYLRTAREVVVAATSMPDEKAGARTGVPRLIWSSSDWLVLHPDQVVASNAKGDGMLHIGV